MVLKYYVHYYYTARVTNCEDKSLYFYLQNYIVEYILIHYHCITGLIYYTTKATNHTKQCYTAGVRTIKDKSMFLNLQDYITKYILTHYYCTAECKLL